VFPPKNPRPSSSHQIPNQRTKNPSADFSLFNSASQTFVYFRSTILVMLRRLSKTFFVGVAMQPKHLQRTLQNYLSQKFAQAFFSLFCNFFSLTLSLLRFAQENTSEKSGLATTFPSKSSDLTPKKGPAACHPSKQP